MNRYGWYYSNPEKNTDSERLVLIGDSFIQGIQISPKDNIGQLLEQELVEGGGRHAETEVISLGMSGSGPAYYYELLRYSLKYNNPSIVAIFVYLGNDFRNCSFAQQPEYEKSAYIYYQLNDHGEVCLDPDSQPAQTYIRDRLDENHNPTLLTIVHSFYSYIFIPNVLETVVDSLAHLTIEEKKCDDGSDAVQLALKSAGINGDIFRSPLSLASRESIEITKLLLLRCAELASDKGVNLFLVTIPMFPKVIYDTYGEHDQTWELRHGEYDFLLPEKILIEYADSIGVDILPMGSYMSDDALTLGEIRELYFNGIGHWSIEGHRYFAKAVSDFIVKRGSRMMVGECEGGE